ncbi:MAG: DUF2059 domain-containing protein [Deltaproteobacteria bacterium]|nr:DUF2059 domain-containing protein [Deltaproteobacteria bacterium]
MKLFLGLFLGLISISVSAESNSKELQTQKMRNINELMKVTDAEGMGRAAWKQMLEAYQDHFKEVDAKVWKDLEKEANFRELVDSMIPIYDKHFTNDEVEALLKFYKSPAGAKYVKEMPMVQMEAFTIGEAWARKLSDRVMAKIEAAEKKATKNQKPEAKQQSQSPAKEKL